jgi:hypothetical protein
LQNPIWNISTAKVRPWRKEKPHPNSADAGVAGDLHTLRIDHLSFFLQSNESNFFSSDCKKAAQHLSPAWLLFLGRS